MSFVGCEGFTIRGSATNYVKGNQTINNTRDSNNSFNTTNYGDRCVTNNGGRVTIDQGDERSVRGKKKRRGPNVQPGLQDLEYERQFAPIAPVHGFGTGQHSHIGGSANEQSFISPPPPPSGPPSAPPNLCAWGHNYAYPSPHPHPHPPNQNDVGSYIHTQAQAQPQTQNQVLYHSSPSEGWNPSQSWNVIPNWNYNPTHQYQYQHQHHPGWSDPSLIPMGHTPHQGSVWSVPPKVQVQVSQEAPASVGDGYSARNGVLGSSEESFQPPQWESCAWKTSKMDPRDNPRNPFSVVNAKANGKDLSTPLSTGWERVLKSIDGDEKWEGEVEEEREKVKEREEA